ncbi:MAG TPA: hypothetical protein VKT26_08585 [Acetobacteraceae bacterium]|nr:hypothetical protein [Acetobacteraceae bacterium]
MTWTSDVAEQDRPDPAFDVMTSRLLRREALRRAAEELNTTSPRGLENVLAQISIEVTDEAAHRHEIASSKVSDADAAAGPKLPGHP